MRNFVVVVSDSRHADYEIEKKLFEQEGISLKICNCYTEEELLM